MTSPASDWITPYGVRTVQADALDTAIPDSAMSDPRMSLAAKGLFAFLLTYQGRPIDPYYDAIEDESEIRAAIEELIACGYAVRVNR